MAAFVLFLFGAFLYWLFFLPRPTPLVIASLAYYPAPMPPNAYAQEDIDLLNDWPGHSDFSGPNVHTSGGAVEWKTEDDAKLDLQERLKARIVRPGGPNRDVVLVYLSGHGILDDKGEPCMLLVPQNSGREGWQPDRFDLPCVSVFSLLDTINKTTTERFGAGVKKIVFLDCNRIDTDWKLGVMYNGFVDRLDEVVTKADGGRKNLVVINSAGSTQVGWTSPEKLGASVFAHFIRRGLAGDASKGSSRVTLVNLFDYLDDKVSGWVNQRYQDVQKPQMFPKDARDWGKDFVLTWSESKPAVDPGPPAADDAKWDKVGKLWKTHDELRPWGSRAGLTGRQRLNALSWEAFEQQLMRLERLAQSGKAYAADAHQLGETLDVFAHRLDESRSAEVSEVYSFPLIDQWRTGPENSPDIRKRVDKWLSTPDKEKESLEPVADLAYLPRAQAGWEWLLGRGASLRIPVDITKMLDVVKQPEDKLGPEPVELHFLRLLTDPRSRAPFPQDASGSQLVLGALKARQRAEQVASSGADERVQYFTRTLIDDADAKRREAEDLLFVGGPNELTDAKRLWADSDKQYQDAETLAAELAHAFDVRDRAFAELPYYAEWLERRRDLPEEKLPPLMKLCVATIDLNHRLANELENALEGVRQPSTAPGAVGPEARLANLRKTLKTVEENLNQLSDSLDIAITINFNKPNDAKSLRDIADLLSVPLLSGERRNSLRDAYLKIPGQQQANPSLTAPATDDQATQHRLMRLGPWRERHPVQAMLDRRYLGASTATGGSNSGAKGDGKSFDESALAAGAASSKGMSSNDVMDAVKQLAADGATLRKTIRDIRKKLEGEATLGVDPAAVVAARSERSKTDCLGRGCAALLTLPSKHRETEDRLHDPVGSLLRFDLHELLAWHGRRAADDFWGDPTFTDADYYDRLASGYLTSARTQETLANESEQALATTLDRRRKAAGAVVAGKIGVAALTEGATEVSTRVDTTPAEGLPQGVLDLFPLDGAEHPILWNVGVNGQFTTRLALATKTSGSTNDANQQRTFKLPGKAVALTDSQWRLRCWYRGHVLDRDFRVSLTGPGREIVTLKPATRYPPTIQVVGDTGKPGAIAFVLDCSGSMNEEVASAAGTAKTTRMERANKALKAVLADLAGVGRYNVSLWLYGHRRGFNTKIPGRDYPLLPVWNTSWGPADPAVSYREDVERVWPHEITKRFDLAGYKDLTSTILDTRKVQPLGFTPLYLSMKRAATEDLAQQDKESPRRLIVITDGADEVWEVSNDPPKAEFGAGDFHGPMYSANVSDLIALFAQDHDHPIQLSTLLLDVEGGKAADIQEQKKFKDFIAKVDKAKAFDVRTARANGESELIDDLRSIVGPTRYGVQLMGDERSEIATPLTQVLTLKEHPNGLRRKYLIKVPPTETEGKVALQGESSGNLAAQAKVAIESDEAEYLTFDSTNYTLSHQRYDPDPDENAAYKLDDVLNPLGDSKDADFNPERFFVAAHLPKLSENQLAGDAVEFPISIQNGNPRRFSPRPAEFWVQIVPVSQRGRESKEKLLPYVYYDLDYRPRMPAPVLNCQARNWPAGADRADITVWFKLQKTEPRISQRIDDIARSDDQPISQLDIPTSPGHKARFGVRIVHLENPSRSQIIVTETHDADDPDLAPVKVQLARRTDEAQEPDEIRRQYLPTGQQIRHIFTYKELGDADLRTQVLQLTPRADLEKDAVRVQKPLRVNILRRQQ